MIQLHDFSIGYGERTLLHEVEAAIPKGSLTALIGRNGTGKSTLLRAIAGLNRRYTGEILLDGRDISDMRADEMAKTLAFVTTERTRIANLKCEDVVAVGRAPYTNWIGRMQDADREIVAWSLASVGMSDYARRTMDKMSDGECQRIMIARALAQSTPGHPIGRTHLVSRPAQPLRTLLAAGSAGARRGQVHPLFDPRTRHRPVACRQHRPHRPAAAGMPADRRDAAERLHRTTVQESMRIIRCCSSYKSTVVTTEYTIEYFTADIGVDEYIERFRDEARFIELCEKCPNFGCSWGCPPFDFDTDEFLRQYKYAHLMATKIIPDRNDIPVEMTQEFIRPERVRIEKELLEMERKYGGRGFAYVGKCLYCSGSECTRKRNRPCLHPDKVRPSLEAFGFDIGRTLSELFGIRLLWGKDGILPEYLMLVSGLFHNSVAYWQR